VTSDSDHKSKDNINYYYYLLAFIDVLGQKEAFQNLDNQPLSDDHPKLIEAHKQTAFFVETLRYKKGDGSILK